MPIWRGQSHKDGYINDNNCQRHALVRCELTTGAPCPALIGEPWDIYCELQEDKMPCHIGTRLYYQKQTTPGKCFSPSHKPHVISYMSYIRAWLSNRSPICMRYVSIWKWHPILQVYTGYKSVHVPSTSRINTAQIYPCYITASTQNRMSTTADTVNPARNVRMTRRSFLPGGHWWNSVVYAYGVKNVYFTCISYMLRKEST